MGTLFGTQQVHFEGVPIIKVPNRSIGTCFQRVDELKGKGPRFDQFQNLTLRI